MRGERRIELGGGVVLVVPDGATITLTIGSGPMTAPPALPSPQSAACPRERQFEDWLRDEVESDDPGATEGSAALFRAYLRYCDRRGGAAADRMTITRFGRSLSTRGYGRRKSRRGRVERIGCRLVAAAHSLDAAPCSCSPCLSVQLVLL